MGLGHAPGPVGFPLLGVWPAFRRDPSSFLLNMAQRYGDVCSFVVAGQRVCLVNRPDLIEEVLVHSASYFEPLHSIRGVSLTDDAQPEFSGELGALLQDTARRTQTILPGLASLAGPAVLSGASFCAFSAGVVWDALRLLILHPAAADRLRAELAEHLHGRFPGPVDVPHLTYTATVIAETMRLHPPVRFVGRVARSECRLFNFLLGRGTACILSPYVMHRNPTFWPDPERFSPDRFQEAAERGRPEFAFFPFGGLKGTISPAESHCLLESVLMLGTLYTAAEFSPDPSAAGGLRVTRVLG